MQYINNWPDMAKLNIPKTVTQDLHRHLLEPFDSKREAKEFWNESSTTLIILDDNDNITQLKESEAWNQIEFALTYPEYTVPLPKGYQLSVNKCINKWGHKQMGSSRFYNVKFNV